jgi:Tol biopolymer transport system component
MADQQAEHGSQRVDAIIAEYIEAVEAGQVPDRQDLLARHPDLATELAAFFADHDKVRQMAEPRRADAEPPTLPPRETVHPPGTVLRYFGDYELLEEIARGGMGVVYKARQVSLNRVVALKMILAGQLASPADVQRFRTEAENAANLDHPNIVPIYEVGEHEGQHYFSMKLIEGGSLAQQTVGSGRPAVASEAAQRAAALIGTVARAVHYAHQRGILHRDLKPGNILLDERGEPHITDFGLARRIEGGAGLTQSGAIVGTPSYMPPEQARAEKGLTTAVDVYALGAILYELLTGRPPFQAATPLDTVLQLLSEEPVPPRRLQTQIPADLETICLKCLQKEPSKRYATAADLADDLRRFLAGEPIAARPVGRLERVAKWARRRPALAGPVAVSVVAMLALGSFIAYFTATLADRNRQLKDEVVRAEEAEQAAQFERGQAKDLARREADARTQAEAQRDRAERLGYARQVSLAQREWQDGHVANARELLDSCQPNLRGWEYRYLDTLFNHLGQRTFRGHSSPVKSVWFSPDGKRIASASEDQTVKVWEVATGREVITFKGDAFPVDRACFSPDGQRLAGGNGHDTVEVWNAATGQLTLTLKGHTGWVHSVAFSPDGKRLLSGSLDNTLKVWDAQTGQLTVSLQGHTDGVNCVAFSPDGKRLVSGSGNLVTGKKTLPGELKVWDAATGQQTLTLKGHTGGVSSVAFSPDGKRLASGSADETVKVWDAATGQLTLTLQGHTGPVSSVAFSPDGQRLASASYDRTVKVWDASLASPKPRRLLDGINR